MQAVLGENLLTIELDSKALCQEVVLSLISQATKNISLFTQTLEYSLYHQNALCQAVSQLVRRNRQAQVRIICNDSRHSIQHNHCLINVAQSYPSFVEIRQPSTQEISPFLQSWCIIDDVGYCHIKNLERFQGTACFNNRLVVKESLDFFNRTWENSVLDQQTRRLSL